MRVLMGSFDMAVYRLAYCEIGREPKVYLIFYPVYFSARGVARL
jgi:hypothetical protein